MKIQSSQWISEKRKNLPRQARSADARFNLAPLVTKICPSGCALRDFGRGASARARTLEGEESGAMSTAPRSSRAKLASGLDRERVDHSRDAGHHHRDAGHEHR